MQKLNWNILNQYLEAGKIISNKHPEKNLWILNYTRTTQLTRDWDEITLACRGLVVDEEGEVVARTLPKFFNDFEYAEGEIPYGQPYEVFVKYDGSLGIVFKYQGEVILASRGSFASEQSQMGKIIFDREPGAIDFILPGFTYAFEIIYPSNRIVVDYGRDEKLILLAAFHTKTGTETSYGELKYWFNRHFKGENSHVYIAEKFEHDDLSTLRSTIQGSDEGYIVRFGDGFRMKVKGEEYCRLHRILTHVSNKSIWESLRFGKPLEEILQRIPDEYDVWVQKTLDELNGKFNEIMTKHVQILTSLKDLEEDKRAFALTVLERSKKEGFSAKIIFSMKNRQSDVWKDLIWKMVRPKFEKAAKTVQELKEAI